MRELSMNEAIMISGGMQAAPTGGEASHTSWWDGFISWVDNMWDRMTGGGGGGGGGLSQRDIEDYCFGVGVAADVGGKYFIGGRDVPISELCETATQRTQELKNKSQDAMCKDGVGIDCP